MTTATIPEPAARRAFGYCCCRYTFGPATCHHCRMANHRRCSDPRLAAMADGRRLMTVQLDDDEAKANDV